MEVLEVRLKLCDSLREAFRTTVAAADPEFIEPELAEVEIWIENLEIDFAGTSELPERHAHKLDIFLRHCPRSIPQAQESA
jgi:hypothetical protein